MGNVMILYRKLALALGVLSAIVATGCGGNTGGLPIVPTETKLTVTGNATFNGNKAVLNAGNATTAEVAGTTVITTTSGTRTLTVTVPNTMIHAGDTFAIGGEGGASATYTETKARDVAVYAWVANSGTLTFTTASDGAIVATVDIDGMTFVVDGTIEGNPATGSFTLTGFVGGVPVHVSGGTGGTVEMIFSAATGGVVNSTAMTTGTVTYTASDALGNTLVATAGTGVSTRKFTFYAAPFTAVGTDFDLTGHGSNFGYCTYNQGGGDLEWIATGGKMKIVEKSVTTMTVQLTNATFVAGNAGTAGTFTVNGTVSRTAGE